MVDQKADEAAMSSGCKCVAVIDEAPGSSLPAFGEPLEPVEAFSSFGFGGAPGWQEEEAIGQEGGPERG